MMTGYHATIYMFYIDEIHITTAQFQVTVILKSQ